VKVRYGGWQLPTVSQAQGCPSWGGICWSPLWTGLLQNAKKYCQPLLDLV